MITFDFFNDSSTELVEKFCEYFKLDKETVEDYFIRVNPDTLTPETLVRKFDLKLNEYDSSQLQIVCRHMTTSTEDDNDLPTKKKFDLKHLDFTDDRNEFDPVQTDVTDSDYLFDNEDAIVVNLNNKNKKKM